MYKDNDTQNTKVNNEAYGFKADSSIPDNNFYHPKKPDYSNKSTFNNKDFFRQGFTKTYEKPNSNTWKGRYGNDFYSVNNDDKLLAEHLFHLNNKKDFNFNKLLEGKIYVYDNNKLVNTNECHSFEEFVSNETLLANINEMQFKQLTPIQKTVIPLILGKFDIMACAQTGSGKTVAFLYPVINSMLKEGPPEIHMNKFVSYPLVLILVPVRELAEQIYSVCRLMTKNTYIRVCKLYGGVKHDTQNSDLKAGIDILISTTGRILDFLKSGRISLSAIKYLIIDEADRLLDMGFEKQLNEIFNDFDLPKSDKRQNLLFSATFSKEVKRTVKLALSPNHLYATNNVEDYVVNENIEQLFYYVEEKDKAYHLHYILQQCKGTVINTKRGVDDLTMILRKGQYNCAAIHGDKSQNERNYVVDNFKLGNIPILIATDVIGRGIDFPNVSYIFNYDMPKNIDDYIHRIGRTGRCGNIGKSISFINDNNKPIVNDLYKLLKKQGIECPDFIEKMANDNKGYSFKPVYGGAFSNKSSQSWKKY